MLTLLRLTHFHTHFFYLLFVYIRVHVYRFFCTKHYLRCKHFSRCLFRFKFLSAIYDLLPLVSYSSSFGLLLRKFVLINNFVYMLPLSYVMTLSAVFQNVYNSIFYCNRLKEVHISSTVIQRLTIQLQVLGCQLLIAPQKLCRDEWDLFATDFYAFFRHMPEVTLSFTRQIGPASEME